MCFLILPDNYGTNPGLADLICYTETQAPGLLSVYFLMEPYLFPFVLYCLLLAVTNTHDAQRDTSSFNGRNLDDRTPIFDGIHMDFGWR